MPKKGKMVASHKPGDVEKLTSQYKPNMTTTGARTKKGVNPVDRYARVKPISKARTKSAPAKSWLRKPG